MLVGSDAGYELSGVASSYSPDRAPAKLAGKRIGIQEVVM